MAYRIFDHTADLGVEITGASQEEIYAGAAGALFDLLTDLSSVRDGMRTLRRKGEGRTDLLVNFLRELLYSWNGKGFLMKRCTVRELAPRRLSPPASGSTRPGHGSNGDQGGDALTRHPSGNGDGVDRQGGV